MFTADRGDRQSTFSSSSARTWSATTRQATACFKWSYSTPLRGHRPLRPLRNTSPISASESTSSTRRTPREPRGRSCSSVARRRLTSANSRYRVESQPRYLELSTHGEVMQVVFGTLNDEQQLISGNRTQIVWLESRLALLSIPKTLPSSVRLLAAPVLFNHFYRQLQPRAVLGELPFHYHKDRAAFKIRRAAPEKGRVTWGPRRQRCLQQLTQPGLCTLLYHLAGFVMRCRPMLDKQTR